MRKLIPAEIPADFILKIPTLSQGRTVVDMGVYYGYFHRLYLNELVSLDASISSSKVQGYFEYLIFRI